MSSSFFSSTHYNFFSYFNYDESICMADGSSSVTTTNPRPASNPSLPIEYQIRPPNLPSVRESPLTGLGAPKYLPRSIWYELWKSKLAFILFATSTTLIYYDYQRTQRYKAQKALNTASEAKEAQNKSWPSK
ncbi:hypothetical protein I4U23_020531 [Adineta vaga]|nr:hypothetical protein I4U23_020531 [Adineta vaga]